MAEIRHFVLWQKNNFLCHFCFWPFSPLQLKHWLSLNLWLTTEPLRWFSITFCSRNGLVICEQFQMSKISDIISEDKRKFEKSPFFDTPCTRVNYWKFILKICPDRTVNHWFQFQFFLLTVTDALYNFSVYFTNSATSVLKLNTPNCSPTLENITRKFSSSSKHWTSVSKNPLYVT